MSRELPARPALSESAVLSKAVVRAAEVLGLTQKQLAEIVGISGPTASRLVSGNYLLARKRAKEWELALLFVRVFRSLDAIWGHDDPARLWLRSHNLALLGKPIDLLGSVAGLVRVLTYLDSARGRV